MGKHSLDVIALITTFKEITKLLLKQFYYRKTRRTSHLYKLRA